MATQVVNPAGGTTFQGDPITEQVGITISNTFERISSWQANSGFLPLISAASGAGHCYDTVPSNSVKEDMEVQDRNSHVAAPISPLQMVVLAVGAALQHVMEATTSGSTNSLLAVSPDQAGMPGLQQGHHASSWTKLWGRDPVVGSHNAANTEHVWDDRAGRVVGAWV